MNYILFDDQRRDHLLPLTFVRPVADIRIGIMTIREKWQLFLKQDTTSITENYLKVKFPTVIESENTLINGGIIPNSTLIEQINSLKLNECLYKGDDLIALKLSNTTLEALSDGYFKSVAWKENNAFIKKEVDSAYIKVNNTWDIFTKNGQALEEDFVLLTEGRTSQPIPDTNNIICPENIFIEAGVEMNFATINAKDAKVYIGKNAKIQEGSLIRGSLALCDNSQLNMGAKIYGPTTIGPYCKVGGEVNNSVIFGYSNKGHEGFLGNSVLAEWCNIGADSNTSNLKNTYEEVKLWDYVSSSFKRTGQQFAGLIMGDHSKCGINTMFNTGTVVGVFANIYGAGFQRNYIPSYSWGSPAGMKPYVLKKVFQVADAVFKRRGKELDQVEQDILTALYNDMFKL